MIAIRDTYWSSYGLASDLCSPGRAGCAAPAVWCAPDRLHGRHEPLAAAPATTPKLPKLLSEDKADLMMDRVASSGGQQNP